ncbi:MAG: D-aminoacyl-tRNA deacylase [Chlamydiae bacterium]|nr:D-aminoacyl-tRNA deacylase [Chlamydiota bacterium]
MKVVAQRVKEAKVVVDGEVCGTIGSGILVLLGIHKDDTPEETSWLVNKLVNLRFFQDENGKMNLSVKDLGGEILVVSQFTLYANCNGGRRPAFIDAAPPNIAEPIYEKFVSEVKNELGRVETGKFGAYMEVSLINDGPVTVILEKKGK